jgi:hypothetical protein
MPPTRATHDRAENGYRIYPERSDAYPDRTPTGWRE